MTMRYSPLCALFVASAAPALAEAPNVVTDFGPTNGIVARVMQGVGAPLALLLPNDTPHSFAMRPSHAQQLSDADVVIWVGAGLTPWLAEPVATLAPDAVSLALLETEGWAPLPSRGAHSHGAAHDDHDGHADHAGHDDHEDHDDHSDANGHDPHAWLDPDIAAVWALTIAETLSAVDPANASVYQTNANQFWADVALLGQEVDTIVAEIDGTRILMPHDSMQYFEARFGLAPAGFIAESDAADPGPAHLRDLRNQVVAGDITCVLGDVETNAGTLTLLTEGTEAKTALLDLTDRKSVGYIGMMQTIIATLVDCTD